MGRYWALLCSSNFGLEGYVKLHSCFNIMAWFASGLYPMQFQIQPEVKMLKCRFAKMQ